jgi:receptor-binding and translocation channel-forming TcA subunit of Tc toxin
VSDFLDGKFTNADLYNWMISQLTAVHAQAYQLAFSLALQAQTAYQYELGRPATDQFVQFGYWDSQYKGLTAADSLLFDLRRMDAQYLAANVRELELTKHVSLALTQPMELVKLLQTGTCQITLNESLFDFDHPGHYFRRLRSVALSIPCVAGPYTSVNATLILNQAAVRTVAPSKGYQPCAWPNPTSDPSVFGSPVSGAPPVIATSGGQNDAGLFDVNLRDERWLPFEGQGAISTWTLAFDRRDNSIDVNSASDIILHLRYSARFGGDAETVRAALKPVPAGSMLVSARSAFSDAYYGFFNPGDAGATAQTLTLPLTSSIFPFSNLGAPGITDVTVVIVLAQPLANDTAAALAGLPWTFGPSSSLDPPAVTFTQLTGPPPTNATANALKSSKMTESGAPGAFALKLALKDKNGKATVPDSLKTTVNGQTLLDPELISDVVLVVGYKLS